MSTHIIVYGDFSCPWSYLASQRVSLLKQCGIVDLEWRAVEHDRTIPATGRPTGPDLAAHKHELAHVAGLALPGEHLPDDVPAALPSTRAAVSAYAEACADGIEDALRERIFDAVWREGRNVSSPYDVRRLVTDLSWPRPDVAASRISDLPQPIDADPDMDRVTRRIGGTVACDGGPLTTDAWRRIRRWREAWLALPSRAVPAVVTRHGEVLTEDAGLAWLARLAGRCPTYPALPPEPPAPADVALARPRVAVPA